MNQDRQRERKDRPDSDLPHRDQSEIEHAAGRSRDDLKAVPEPGADPLHEGP